MMKPVRENYQISPHGEVLANPRKDPWGRWRTGLSIRLIERQSGRTGYRHYRINGKMEYTHMLLAEAYIDNPHNYKYVRHINGNIIDNRLSNLEWSKDEPQYEGEGE